MRRADQVVHGIFGYRFEPRSADHALLICHGAGGYGGIYDPFCERYAAAGADVWTLDLPGFGRSTSSGRRGSFTAQGWIDAVCGYAEEITVTTGLPLVVLGSSLGTFAAAGASFVCDDITACVLMGGAVVPGLVSVAVRNAGDTWGSEPVQQLLAQIGEIAVIKVDRLVDFDVDYGFRGALAEKQRDPLNTWEFDLASWASLFTYSPARPAEENSKPTLFSIGDLDPLVSEEQVREVAAHLGGPVQVHITKNGPHQLMLFRTADYVDIVRDFVTSAVL